MPNIIHIETSTSVCSAALSSDGVVQCHFENFEGPSHASLLGVYVKQIMDFSRDKGVKVDAVAVSSGPGSYTGLRIGVSEAKGLCFGLKVPLISVPTLELLACTTMFRNYFEEDVLYCPMIDARRMEVYSAVYDNALNDVVPVGAYVIDEHTFSDLLDNRRIVFAGNGSTKCKDVIKTSQCHICRRNSSIGYRYVGHWPSVLSVTGILKTWLISNLLPERVYSHDS